MEELSDQLTPLSEDQHKDYLKVIKSKRGNFLIKLTEEERKRIAEWILTQYELEKPSHDEKVERHQHWDDVSRLKRAEIQGSDGSLPNYRMPISLVTHEVIHANIMNVFFTPADLLRVLPTEENDIEKVEPIENFGNWSVKNELKLPEKCDRLFRLSEKVGESVYMIYWMKDYKTRIRREPRINPDTGETMYDEITQKPVFDEIEEPYLAYNAPVMEVIQRKDYIFPKDTGIDETPPWEARLCKIDYDTFLRNEKTGLYYEGSIDQVKNWPMNSDSNIPQMDKNDDAIKVGRWKSEFIEFYGRIRLTCVKMDKNEQEIVEMEELEDELIGLVNIESRVLCQLRKNKFPLKMRPFGLDIFIPDDSGQREGVGIYELTDSLQSCYDVLLNSYIDSVGLANEPIVFFTPAGNMRDEKFRIQRGYAYPTSDANSVKIHQFPGPTQSLMLAMQLVEQWAQLLFGISDYAAGIESKIDPDAPAKKAEIVVEQGNVRLNLIVKRKIRTLQDIFKRWFLLYRDNMPANKFMRIAGAAGEDPFTFKKVSYEDFALKSIPDFELTGNVLNANKQLELNKAIAVYRLLSTNVLFNPMSREGLMAQSSLVKWLVAKIDDIGLNNMLPQFKTEGQVIHTPEEENSYMMQGEPVEPVQGEDHMTHLRVHQQFVNNPTTPEPVRQLVAEHIKQTLAIMKSQMAQQFAAQQQAQQITESMQGIQNGPAQQAPIAAGGSQQVQDEQGAMGISSGANKIGPGI